jgi:hypothetical protein
MHRATSEANMQATSVLTGHEIMDFYVSFFKMLAGLTQLQQIFLWLVLQQAIHKEQCLQKQTTARLKFR